MDFGAERGLREVIIGWVAERAEANGGFLYRDELLSYRVQGEDMALIDRSRGIRNPRQLSATLSIVSSAHGPYDDLEADDGLLHYSYRSGDPFGGDNRKLRVAFESRMPLIYFRKERANYYMPIAPVYVVDDLPEQRAFAIALDKAFLYFGDPASYTDFQRSYARRLVKQRLHQPAFRTRVLVAYETHCAVCRLRHGSLLDAAHITADSEGGDPTVTNGLALCKIHHSAYDQNMLGISANYRVHIATKLLAEVDGPMLKHGLQEMDGAQLYLPSERSDRPDPDRLAHRFAAFTAASGSVE